MTSQFGTDSTHEPIPIITLVQHWINPHLIDNVSMMNGNKRIFVVTLSEGRKIRFLTHPLLRFDDRRTVATINRIDKANRRRCFARGA